MPKDINIQEVNEAQLIAIYQHELQQKARSGAYGSARASTTDSSSPPQRGRTTWRGAVRGRRQS
jgi:hypothetical protein